MPAHPVRRPGQDDAGRCLWCGRPVAFSTPTARRVLAGIDAAALAVPRAARAVAREVAWLQVAETRNAIPPSRAGGRDLSGLVLDLDATLVTCHSDREQARGPSGRRASHHAGPGAARVTGCNRSACARMRAGSRVATAPRARGCATR